MKHYVCCLGLNPNTSWTVQHKTEEASNPADPGSYLGGPTDVPNRSHLSSIKQRGVSIEVEENTRGSFYKEVLQ